MSVRVVNICNPKLKAKEKLVLVNRQSPVGNPWFIGSDMSVEHRIDVCTKYKEYFYRVLDDNETSESLTRHYGFTVNKKAFINYLVYIYKLAKTQDIALGCHCVPLMCHGEVIKEYIEKLLEDDE